MLNKLIYLKRKLIKNNIEYEKPDIINKENN